MQRGLAAKEGEGGQHQHDQRRDLDAAGGRGAASADQHQQHGHQGRAVVHAGCIDGVEPRGARCDGLKPAGPYPRGRAVQTAQRGRVSPFEKSEHDPGEDDQTKRAGKHQLGMQRQVGPVALLVDVTDDDEPKTAEDEQGRDHDIDDRIADIERQAPREQREARVVEGRDTVEHGVPDALRPAELRHPDDRQGHHADSLAQQCDREDDPHQHRQVVQRGLVQVLAQDQALRHADGNPQRRQNQHRKGHQAKSAQLDQHHDDAFAKDAEGRADIDRRQARHSYGRGRDEERCEQRDRLRHRNGQPQQQAAGQDRHEVEQPQRRRWRQPEALQPKTAARSVELHLETFRESVQVLALTEQQQQIVALKRAGGAVLSHEFGATHHADTAQVVILRMRQLRQLASLEAFGNAEIHDMVAVSQADVVTHERVVQDLRDMLADLELGMDHPVYAKLGQDAVMRLGPRLGPHHRHADQLEVHDRKDRRFQITAHGDKRHVAIADTGLTQGGVVTGIDDHRLRDLVRHVRDGLVVHVDADDMIAKARQLIGDGAAEDAKTDDAEGPSALRHGGSP